MPVTLNKRLRLHLPECYTRQVNQLMPGGRLERARAAAATAMLPKSELVGVLQELRNRHGAGEPPPPSAHLDIRHRRGLPCARVHLNGMPLLHLRDATWRSWRCSLGSISSLRRRVRLHLRKRRRLQRRRRRRRVRGRVGVEISTGASAEAAQIRALDEADAECAEAEALAAASDAEPRSLRSLRLLAWSCTRPWMYGALVVLDLSACELGAASYEQRLGTALARQAAVYSSSYEGHEGYEGYYDGYEGPAICTHARGEASERGPQEPGRLDGGQDRAPVPAGARLGGWVGDARRG